MKQNRILILEDQPDIRELVGFMLEEAGYGVGQAETGEQCLKLFSSYDPDLLIADISLPDVDGWEVISRLNGSDRHLPVLVMSGTEHAGQKLLAFNRAYHQS